MSDLEKLLEDVARDFAYRENFTSIETADEVCLRVLKRRLLPLLEAGQQLRDEGHKGEWPIRLMWDAALEKAKGK